MITRVGIFGLGRMGTRHLRVAAAHPDVRVVGLVDPRLAGSVESGMQVSACEGELGEIDVAIVATPPALHAALATTLLERGVDVLVEKPLAMDRAACVELAAVAARTGRTLAVGHVERFNPAFRALSRALPAIGELEDVTFERLGTSAGDATARADVLLELAIHDLDLLAVLAGDVCVREARCAPLDPATSAEIHLVARGATATIRVDSAASGRSRRVVARGRFGTIEADLIARTCASWSSGAFRALPVEEHDPLTAQLDAFLSMRRGLTTGVCDVADATRAVSLAEEARRLGRRVAPLASARW